MPDSERAPLTRANHAGRPVPPVRLVHIGLGAFHRSHLAWYTDRVDRHRDWGIAAFTVRSADAADRLSAQDGLYTLVERSRDGDSFSIVESLVETRDGADLERLCELVAAPATAVLSITVTEAGYHLGADGVLDATAIPVSTDLDRFGALTADGSAPDWAAIDHSALGLQSLPARAAVALAARRSAGAGGIAVVSCDNLSRNGAAARSCIAGFAELIDPDLASWIDANVSFVDTSVDRITPHTTPGDIGAASAGTGFADRSPVVTEPFASFILSGEFPAGRPPWEDSGAVFVERIEQSERRKLWLLNGAHSLLAYLGMLRGHKTVADAISDAYCAEKVDDLWNEASAHLTDTGLDIPGYRAALLERFGNSRIEHRLAQIATDDRVKLRMRAVPMIAAERAQRRSGSAAAFLVAAWIGYLRAAADLSTLSDAERAEIEAALSEEGQEQVTAFVGMLDRSLAADASVVDEVAAHLATLDRAFPRALDSRRHPGVPSRTEPPSRTHSTGGTP